MPVFLLLAMLLTAAATAPLPGQTRGSLTRRVSLTVSLGSVYGRFAEDVQSGFRDNGLTDTRVVIHPAGCFGFLFTCTPYPERRTSHRYPIDLGRGGRTAVAMRVEISNRLALGIRRSTNRLGGATGYEAKPSPTSGREVTVDYSSVSTGATAHLKIARELSVGLGPTRHDLKDRGSPGTGHSVVGLTGEVVLRLPDISRVFLEVSYRRNWVPAQEIRVQTVAGSRALHPQLNHDDMGIGLGIRF